ncbi:hypothetical protein [Arthrobacter pigmenti]
MRTLFSAFAGIVAVVLCFVAVPGLWLDRNVVSEDGFVHMVSPLGSEAEFQEQLAEATAQTVIEDASLGPALTEMVRPLAQQAAENLTENPQYQQAWEETLRSSHELTFPDDSGNTGNTGGSDTQEPDTSAITLDIAPLVSLAAQEAGAAVGVEVPVPEQVLVEVGGANQQTALAMVQNYADLAVPFAIAAAVAFALAMLIARRRSTTLVLVGIGVAVAAGLWKLAAEYGVRQLETSRDANELAALFKAYFADVGEASFNEWIVAGAGAGAVMILVGLIARIFAGSRT